MARQKRGSMRALLKEIEQQRVLQNRRGYSNNDDSHVNGELLEAAKCYMDLSLEQIHNRDYAAAYKNIHEFGAWVPPGGSDFGYPLKPGINKPPSSWPMKKDMWAASSPRYNLIRAASLILAELERLERQDKAMQPKKKKMPPSYYEKQEGLYDDAVLTLAPPTPSLVWNPSANATAVINQLYNQTSLTNATSASTQLLGTGTI